MITEMSMNFRSAKKASCAFCQLWSNVCHFVIAAAALPVPAKVIHALMYIHQH